MPAPVLLTDLFSSTDWLALLDVSLTGFILFRPAYNEAADTILDFAYEHLNRAAQQMLGLPQRPAESFLTLFPMAEPVGIFAFYREAFLSGQPQRQEFNYQHNGLDGYFHLAAQRQGPLLVVSFTDTNDQSRSVVEQALRDSQAAERAASAEAELQRQRFYDLLMQLPAQVAVHEGPDQVFTLVNPGYQRLAPGRALLGQSVRAAWPELVSQGILDVLDQVYQTGEPFIGQEMASQVDFTRTGQLEQIYFDTFFLPLRDAQGQVSGVFDFSYDVTEQVEARQQVQTLNEELAALNEELRASNEEYQQANTALSETQQQLHQLNQELEARVQARTQEALALQADLLAVAQHQAAERLAFYQIFEQVPVLVALLRAPGHRFEYVNPAYQSFFPGCQLVGLDAAEAAPELQAQGFVALMDHVYHTGETYVGQEVPFAPPPAPGQVPSTNYFNFIYQAYRENGQVVGITVLAFDITEQVLARQEREAQQQELEQLFMLAPAPIVILDGPDRVFQLVNPAYQRIFPGRVLAGKPLLEALPELVGTPIPDLLDRVYQTGESMTVQELPLWMARHEGQAPEEIYWTFAYQPRRAAHGSVDGVHVFAHDVTEQVRTRQRVQELNETLADTNQELAASNEQLTATNEELYQSNNHLTRTNLDLDTFVYTASHDLKAPITNIEGLLDALRHHLPAEVQQDELTSQLLGMMQGAVERFQYTITQLTDVSRLQHAQNQPSEQVQFAAVVEDVRLDLLPLLTSTNAHLTVRVSLEVYVLFSPKNLRSVVYNLLSNALKYQHPGRPPVVVLRAYYQDQTVVLTVTDNGLGMSKQQQTRLFGLFQRLHTHVEGTGVGLYMVKRVVDNVGGTITVQSEVGVGTTFTVTLPR